MKYIEKVILNNFQSHKNTSIEFDNRLNVIVGPSDSGKTAILRGIRWALYNEPSGDYFIREGESECSVTIIFSDGIKIKRYRSKSKNAYYLYDSNGNEIVFEGFGLSVPEEIIEKTGIKKILLDSDLSKSINFSDQLEGPFLLSERGSTRASSIGRLVGVNIIDDALRESLRDSRNLSNNKKLLDENIEKLEKELQEYKYLTELSIKIANLEKVKKDIKYKYEILYKYKELLEKLTPLSIEQENLNYYMKKLKKVDLLDNTIKDITIIFNKYKYLTRQQKILTEISKNIYENSKISELLKNVDMVEKKIKKINHLYSLQYKLNEFRLKSKKHKNEISLLEIESGKLKNLQIMEENINNINLKSTQLIKMNLVSNKINNVRKNLKTGKEYISKLLEIDNIVLCIEELQSKIVTLSKLNTILKRYNINSKDMKNQKNILELQSSMVEEQLLNYKNLLLKLGSCPLCYSTIDDDKAKHIISQYD